MDFICFFSGMKVFGDYVYLKGFKFGVYELLMEGIC